MLPPEQPHPQPSTEVTRFGARPRIEHALVLVIFVALLGTGLPQRSFEAEWARSLIVVAGGLQRVRLVHQVAGWLLVALTVEHVVVSAWLLVARGRTSMLVGRRDFLDALAFLRWCLGRRRQPPEMDRFHYRQKFEYWALLLGVVTMAASGLVLMFPLAVTAVLPGVVVAAARLAHGSEALLALGAMLAWHLYSTVLNPEVFPLDRSIFTGRISIGRMRREHPLEYQRRLRDGRLEGSGGRTLHGVER